MQLVEACRWVTRRHKRNNISMLDSMIIVSSIVSSHTTSQTVACLSLTVFAGFDLVADCAWCIKDSDRVTSTICTVCNGGLAAPTDHQLC